MANTGTQFSGSIRIVAALSVAFLIAVVGARWGTRNAPPVIVKRPIVDLRTDRTYVAENDTDGDGVPDWLETLQGSDPSDPKSKPAASTTPTTLDAFASEAPNDNSLTAQTLNRMIDGYLALKKEGLYTSERGQALGQSVADRIRVTTPFSPYVMSDIVVTPESSAKATLAHRSHVQTALKPLLTTRDPDIIVYGLYLEHKDPSYLKELSERAAEYRAVGQALVRIPAPPDIAETHLATINALMFYASVLDNMVARAEDPFASMALLSVFNRSEQYVETSINKLNELYRIKMAS